MDFDIIRTFNDKNKNPFEKIRTQNEKNKEKKDDSYKEFDKFNPFTQINTNTLNHVKNNFFNNIEHKNEIKENSQKKFTNNYVNDTYTPDTSIIDNEKNIFIQNNSLINKIIEKKENDDIKLDYPQNICSIKLSSISKEEPKKVLVIGKKISNNNDIKNNIFPIYENDINIPNIDNINKIIKGSEIEKEPKVKEILPNSINSNLGVIKEEQNESDKELGVFQKYNLNSKINNLNIGDNNNIDDLISIDKMIEESLNEIEIEKIVKDNSEQIDSLLSSYNINIIFDIINLDIDSFKIAIDKFILDSKKTINKLKILDNIQNNIKEKLIAEYELQAKKCELKNNEFQKLKEYEEKLDYIIMAQNQLIEKLQDINRQLANNLKESKCKEEIKINEEELKKNIANANSHLDELENFIITKFTKENYEFNEIEINHLHEITSNEQIFFFELMEKIYSPLIYINKEYQKLIFMAFDLNNKIE